MTSLQRGIAQTHRCASRDRVNLRAFRFVSRWRSRQPQHLQNAILRAPLLTVEIQIQPQAANWCPIEHVHQGFSVACHLIARACHANARNCVINPCACCAIRARRSPKWLARPERSDRVDVEGGSESTTPLPRKSDLSRAQRRSLPLSLPAANGSGPNCRSGLKSLKRTIGTSMCCLAFFAAAKRVVAGHAVSQRPFRCALNHFPIRDRIAERHAQFDDVRSRLGDLNQ